MIQRVFWWLALGVCGAYVVLVVAIQIGQHVVRRRAERLAADLQVLRVGASTWSDFQGFQKRWGRWGHYDGECTASHCEYRIGLRDWFAEALSHADGVLPDERGNLGSYVMSATRAHMPGAYADVSIGNGVVTAFSSGFQVGVPNGHYPGSRFGEPHEGDPRPYSYTLLVTYESGRFGERYPTTWLEPTRPHPSFEVSEPSGCENCIAITLTSQEGTSLRSLGSFADISWGCMTGWSFCAVEKDIAPNAWRQYLADKTVRSRMDRCDYPFSQMFEAAENVMLVSVEPTRTEDTAGSRLSGLSVRFVKAIKGKVNFKLGEVLTLWEDGGFRYVMKGGKSANSLIILFPGSASRYAGPSGELEAYECGIMDATPGRLTEMASPQG